MAGRDRKEHGLYSSLVAGRVRKEHGLDSSLVAGRVRKEHGMDSTPMAGRDRKEHGLDSSVSPPMDRLRGQPTSPPLEEDPEVQHVDDFVDNQPVEGDAAVFWDEDYNDSRLWQSDQEPLSRADLNNSSSGEEEEEEGGTRERSTVVNVVTPVNKRLMLPSTATPLCTPLPDYEVI